MRIIIIDDHPAMREGLRALLNHCGRAYEIVAEYGRFDDALAELEFTRPALILSDYRLPDMSASQFMRRLRNEGHEVAVMFVSASTDPFHVKEVLRLGSVGFLSKTAGADELRRALDAQHHGEVWVSSDALDGLMHEDRVLA